VKTEEYHPANVNYHMQFWINKLYSQPCSLLEADTPGWDTVILLPQEEGSEISEDPEGCLETVFMFSMLWDAPALSQIQGYARY